MKISFKSLSFTTLLACALSTLQADQFQLVDKEAGLAPARIIVYEDAPPRTRDAAVTLAEYIGKICGQEPEVQDGLPSPIPGRAIWVGYQPALNSLFPDTDFKFQHPEETLIVANGQHLVLAGRDRWNPEHMEAKGRLSTKTGMQQEYGTANAIYTFIQEHLGVRWLWPGEEDVVPSERITIPTCEIRYHPQIRARGRMFTKLSLGDNKEGPDELWARWQRVQLDSMETDGGHGFGHWWEKYSKSNPEYFAAAPDGTRPPNSFSERMTKLCASNPAVWKQWLEEVQHEIEQNPTKTIFNVSPNDGYSSGHCTCSNCLAWDHPDGEKMTWRFAGGVKFEGTSQTDRDVRFANTLARMLDKQFPGRGLQVKLNAYGFARNPPIAQKPDDNVIIASVANFHMRSPAHRQLPMEQHAGWAKVAKHLIWRPNLGNQAGMAWGMPDIAIREAAEDFRFVADHGCIGLYFDMLWFHWANHGPQYYALAHLAWNPYTDVEALMADYYQRGFGQAASDVQAYWQLFEKTRMEFVSEELSRLRAFHLPKKYTPDLLAKAQTHLDSAKKKVAGQDPKYTRRLHFLQCGLDFTHLLVDTRRWMQKYEASHGKDAHAKAQVLANWKTVDKMKKDFPEFAINWWGTFQEPRPGQKPKKRIMGLHPDSPLTGRWLRELQADGLE